MLREEGAEEEKRGGERKFVGVERLGEGRGTEAHPSLGGKRRKNRKWKRKKGTRRTRRKGERQKYEKKRR